MTAPIVVNRRSSVYLLTLVTMRQHGELVEHVASAATVIPLMDYVDQKGTHTNFKLVHGMWTAVPKPVGENERPPIQDVYLIRRVNWFGQPMVFPAQRGIDLMGSVETSEMPTDTAYDPMPGEPHLRLIQGGRS